MASKAYVASMTVAELTAELKKRGLNCKGKKKTLQNRLEQALYDEENSETSSESNEEATIRAASAVINQLEGPLNEVLPTEELIVSIEHSKRTREPNEEHVIQTNHNTNDIYVHVSTDANEQSLEQHIFPDHVTSSYPSAHSVPQENLVPPPTSSVLYQTQELVVPVQTSVLNEENLVPPPTSSVLYQTQEPMAPVQSSVLNEENLVPPPTSSVLYQTQEPMAPVQTSVLIEENVHDNVEDKVNEMQVPEETIPIEERSNVQETERSEDFSHYINVPSESSIDTPTIEDPSIILPVAMASIEERPVILPVSENPPTSSIGSTPVSSAGPNFSLVVPSVSPGSVGDLESESEVNSIAVEPPSPIRDEISVVLEEGSVSFLKEESTPQPPEVPEVTKQIEEEPKTTIKETPMETSTQEDVTCDDSRETDIAAVPTEDVVLSTDTVPSSLPDSVVDEGKGHIIESQQVVSSDSGVDSSHIELDVVVPTVEDDDFSVFSVEAAEAQQKLDTASGSSQKRPSSLSSFASNGRSGNDLGGVVSKNETDEQTRKRQSSVPDREIQESNETSITKRRRISTSPRRSQERRRRWGSSTSRTPTSTQLAISSDTLETIIPEEVKEEVAETLSGTALESVMDYDMEDEKIPDNDEEIEGKDKKDEPKQDDEDIVDLGKESSMMDEYEQEWQEKEREKELQKREAGRAKHEQETRHKLETRLNSQQREDRKERQPLKPRSPSPAWNSPSRILHIENLTRPFTILQLKELLQEDGLMVEGGFWTNRIKSHCIAIYSSTDTAIATRNRLHGLKWPSTNPKLLRSDFLDNKMVTEISEGQMIIESRSPSPVKEMGSHDNLEPVIEPPIMITKKEESNKDPVITIKPEEKPKEEKPTRVLDDLFRKTKTIPSIYWLPLSPEEIEVKEKERKARETEREKRRMERQKEREKEMEEMERERRERERRIREERERRAKERINRRSRSRSPQQSRSRSRTPRRSRSRSISPRRRR